MLSMLISIESILYILFLEKKILVKFYQYSPEFCGSHQAFLWESTGPLSTPATLQHPPRHGVFESQLVALGPRLGQVLGRVADHACLLLSWAGHGHRGSFNASVDSSMPYWVDGTLCFPLPHCEAGSATLGRRTVVAWYPPLMPFSEPLPVVTQSWFPLFSYVKDRERATAHPCPSDGGVAVARVVWVEGLVQDWGLFLSSDLAAKVLVQCSFSPSGYGSRSLSGAELGALWDIPISVLDALPTQGSERILQGIFRSDPTKILFAGPISY
jgi:hypothetical protein